MSQNYQSTVIWISSVKTFACLTVCLALALVGVPAPLIWCLTMGLLLPVGVALRLHLLQQNNQVILPGQKTEWVIYVYGIPVRETQSSLQNPFFLRPERLRRFFLGAWGLKGALQLALIGALLRQLAHGLPGNRLLMSLLAAGGALALGFMLRRLWQTAQALRAAWSGSWRVEQGDVNGTACFRALVARKAGEADGGWQPALARFLQL